MPPSSPVSYSPDSELFPPMDIFKFRNDLIENYSSYVRSFFEIHDEEIRAKVDEQFRKGLLWPEVLIQLNPSFKPGQTSDALAESGDLHPRCAEIFQRRKEDGTSEGPLTFHTHQVDAIRAATAGGKLRPNDGDWFRKEPVLHRPDC